MWALGIILYLLYFKKFPFEGKNFSEIKKKVFYEPIFYPVNVKIRKSLVNLIDKLLNKDYTTRISCADESFINYFNDNDESKEAFFINRSTHSKSNINKKINRYIPSLKASDVKQLLDNIKTNKK